MIKYLGLVLIIFFVGCKEINYPVTKTEESTLGNSSSMVYEFTPKTAPYKQCIVVVTGLGVGVDCWNKI